MLHRTTCLINPETKSFVLEGLTLPIDMTKTLFPLNYSFVLVWKTLSANVGTFTYNIKTHINLVTLDISFCLSYQ